MGRLMFWRRKRRFAHLVALGDQARARRDWPEAAAHYARALAAGPANAPIWIQYGHALTELGSMAEAEQAYGRALALTPGDAEALLRHGHALKLIGRREEAIATLSAAHAAAPGDPFVYDELLRLGARDRTDDDGARRARSRSMAAVEITTRRAADALAEAARHAAYPVRSHDEFRHDFPIAPPPPFASEGEVLILIDAQAAVPALLRSTLLSLIDQATPAWRALVVGPDAMGEAPVGSFAFVELRIAFGTLADAARAIADAATLVVLEAGTILDPQGLAWLCAAAARTGAHVVHADHDHGVEEWRQRIEYRAPAFYWAHDPEFLAATGDVPAVVLANAAVFRTLDAAALLAQAGAGGLCRALLLAPAARGHAAHVPRLLATKLALPAIAQAGLPDPPAPPRPMPARAPAIVAPDRARIHVIIPTRDEPAMLARCIATLRDAAARIGDLRMTIVDNRSTLDETRRLLASGAMAGEFAVLPFDEPFNWSRANNLAAAGSDAEILLFLNNDTEMMTWGWDDRLRARFHAPDVGAVGVRLLYPDGAIQHAGILLGLLDGLPVHEALGAPGNAAGPLGRWITPRRVSAVTGACLAVRRNLFERIGGFDERRLFVAYNDVDLCLRVREAGCAVVYDALIELIHHESRSRGQAITQSQVAWDHAERATLHGLWGDAMFDEPSYNPHWPLRGVPLDGLREPTLPQILDHIDRSARALPWRAERGVRA